MIKLDVHHALPFLPEDWFSARQDRLAAAAAALQSGAGAGGDFTGWVNQPAETDKEAVAALGDVAGQLRADCEVLVVVGVGGSYLGARALLELLMSPAHNLMGAGPKIFFAGNHLSADALNRLLIYLEGRSFAVNVISKSGTTTEPAVAFLLLKNLLEARYGKEGARERIVVTTDASEGSMRRLVEEEGYSSFVIPRDIGGRYSVLTPVGLLPLAVAGVDIAGLLEGAAHERQLLLKGGADNAAWRYAAARHALYTAGKKVEVLAVYEPSLRYFGEWYKQLFGESEGKEGRGVFPASVEFTADLHSLGQYIQEGERFLFETVLTAENVQKSCPLPVTGLPEALSFLQGKTVEELCRNAVAGTMLAHCDGGVPNLHLSLPRIDAVCVGALVYFFEYACGLSAYLLEVNPFNQPGVEAYKKNMLALLGKPGLEELGAALRQRLREGAQP